jgi:hypothetical protein
MLLDQLWYTIKKRGHFGHSALLSLPRNIATMTMTCSLEEWRAMPCSGGELFAVDHQPRLPSLLSSCRSCRGGCNTFVVFAFFLSLSLPPKKKRPIRILQIGGSTSQMLALQEGVWAARQEDGPGGGSPPPWHHWCQSCCCPNHPMGGGC